MNRFALHPAIALLLALAAAPPALATGYIDQRGSARIHGDANAGAAKATVCFACHGPNGNALVPAFPRLAGQRADYLYWELVKFKRGTRPQSPMTAQAATLSDEDMRNLATYFSAQAATTGAPASVDPAETSRGEALFLHGDPARGNPPCQGCHGATANGLSGDAHAAYPALRGQHADYLVQRLKDYRDGKLTDSSNDFIMRGVAHGLDDAAITTLAAYLSALAPIEP
ncbi:MAG TPA: c-type cytochrome [Dokdonella sp.]